MMSIGKSKTKRKARKSDDDDVGYGKPPVGSRFKPGQSGNPRGRPKGARNAATIVSQILNHRVTIQSPTGPKKGSLREAMIWKQVELAIKGDGKAFRTLIETDERHREQTGGEADAGLSANDEAILMALLERKSSKAAKPGNKGR